MTISATTDRANPATDFSNVENAEADRALVDWVRKEYQRMKQARNPYERQWRLNYAMYKGRQNLSYANLQNIPGMSGTGRLVDTPAPPWRVRAVRNRIKPIIRTELARLISNKPNASVVPASSEDEDLFAAQAGEQVWEYHYNTQQLHKAFTRSMFWVCITGVGFIKTWWDNEKFDERQSDPNAVGCVCSSPVTPFHLFVPNLLEEELEEQPYILNAYTKPVDWVKTVYGITTNPTVVSANELLSDSMFKAQSQADAKPDACLVYEMWIKPLGHPRFPQGGMVTIVDNQIVDIFDQGLPYNHGQYPFIKFEHIPTGEFYADSVINDLISPQREYNRTTSQIIEAKNRMAKPQLKAPQGSIDASKVTSEPGQIIFYKPGFGNGPEPLPMQPLPAYVINELQHAISDMEDISSQHAVSRGETPSGVTAATAISYLQERDDSPMTNVYQSIEYGWEKWSKQVLSLCVQYWDIPRIVSVTGIENYFDAITLKGAELKNGTDVRVEAGSALPVSKAARQAFLMDLMKGGFVPPERALALMDMGGIQKLYDELRADESAAQRENLRMRRLDIEQVLQHQKQVEASKMQAQQAQQMQMQMQQGPDPSTVQQQMPGLPQDITDPNNALAAVQGLEQMLPSGPPPQPQLDAGFGQDQQSQAPLTLPANIVPVNTWDNHQVHIDVHNRFRKSQAFDLLPDPIKMQFEAHVQAHAAALGQAAQNASMQMPADPGMGPQNGSGTPIGPPGPQGGNQFPPDNQGGGQ